MYKCFFFNFISFQTNAMDFIIKYLGTYILYT